MSSALPVDPGLLERLKDAYSAIVWTEAAVDDRPGTRNARTARLHDESARVETWESTRGDGLAVTSGPVGALVLLIEIDRRGAPNVLGARNAGKEALFPDGAIVATWGEEPVEIDTRPRLKDVVELARYALP